MSDPEPFEFERAHRRRRRLIGLVIGLCVLGPVGWVLVNELQVASVRRQARLTAEQRAELSGMLDRREARARLLVEQWNQALQPEALGALKPGALECPLTLVPPAQASAGAYVKFGTRDVAFGSWTLCIVRPPAGAPACARTFTGAKEVAALRERLAAGDIYTWDLEQAKAAPPGAEPPSVLVVVSGEVKPVVHSPAVGKVSVVPGTLVGRSFLFAPAQGRFICAGDVSVKNSKNVDIEYALFGAGPAEQQSQAEYETRLALERDLEVHLRFAAARALRQLEAP